MSFLPRQELIIVAAFTAVNLLIRFLTLNLNAAEYTDGILQLTVFSNPSGLYPPLYGGLATIAARCFSFDLETGGRIVSAVAGGLTVIPMYAIARLAAGPRAALIALLLFTVSPLSLRWSNRVMTDSLFLFLSTSTMMFVTAVMKAQRCGAFRLINGFAGGAVAVAGLATLTRYQGILLLAPVAVMLADLARHKAKFPWAVIPAGLVWLALPWWMLSQGFEHQDQLVARTAQDPAATLAAYWNTFESFVLISPYYFGYPVVLMALCAAVARRNTPFVQGFRASFLSPWLSFGVPILLLQSAFGSFQYRYMMPLLPAMLVVAAAGGAALQTAMNRRQKQWLFYITMGISVAYLGGFSAAVLWCQREAFGDQKQAAVFFARTGPETHLFSNERYGDFLELGSPKISYWSGRKVQTVFDNNSTSGLRLIPPGSLLAVGTAYGGDQTAAELVRQLERSYQVTPLLQVPFKSELLPLMDDIMVNPLNNQNPTGWVMRYIPQVFTTQIFRIDTPAPAPALFLP